MLTKFISSKRLSFLFTFLFISVQLYSQIYQPNRFEVEIEDKDYEVLSAEEDGLFIISSYVDFEKGGLIWDVTKLDTAFKFQWQRSFSVPSVQFLSGKYYDSNQKKLYFLFSRKEPKNRDLELISFDGSNGMASSSIIKNFIPIDFFDFKVNDLSVVIAGYFNAMPLVILYNIVEGVPIVLPGLFGNRREILQLIINDDQSFDISVSGQDFNKQAAIFLNTYNFSGVLLKSVKIKSDSRRELLFGMTTKLDNEDRLVAGIYGKYFSDFSKGLFLANIDKNENQTVNYYNYADLKNFFNYMKINRERRVKERIKRRKIKGKKLRFNYRLMVNDLIEMDDYFVLMGEAFYPKFRLIGGTYNGSGRVVQSYSNGLVQNNRVFEGYYYTHAVVIGFNKTGELLWDNSFEINKVLSMDLKQFVHVSANKDKIALLYILDNNLRSKIISNDNALSEAIITPIAMKYKDDIVNSSSTDVIGLEEWYSNVFYTYGKQSVKNLSRNGVELNREVFFINKVIYK